MWWHHAADRCHTALLQPSAVSLRHIMTSIPPPSIRPRSRLLPKPAPCEQPCRSTSAISTAERIGASNRSPAHMQGPIAQAASAQKMFLTRSATDVLQGLPACRQHYPHSAKTSAPSFNPASMRSRSRSRPGRRCAHDLTEPSRLNPPDSPLRRRVMPKSYSGDLRERVIEAVEGGASRRETAERFEVSVSSAVKWLKRWHESKSAVPKPG